MLRGDPIACGAWSIVTSVLQGCGECLLHDREAHAELMLQWYPFPNAPSTPCRDVKSSHKSRSREPHSSRRRRHKSEVTDSSEDEFGGYVPRKRQEIPRASKIKPATATREPSRKRGCAAQAHIMHRSNRLLYTPHIRAFVDNLLCIVCYTSSATHADWFPWLGGLAASLACLCFHISMCPVS